MQQAGYSNSLSTIGQVIKIMCMSDDYGHYREVVMTAIRTDSEGGVGYKDMYVAMVISM